ncbi:MAG: C25 family cysteine peptidase [Dokdonella sp.]
MNFHLLRWCAGAGLLLAAPLSFACSGVLHIEIEHEGVYSLDYASVIAKQPKLVDCRADQLLLSHRDGDVPMRVVADDKGMFGPGSRIEWIGHHLRGPESYNDHFSINNVYQLHAAEGSHPRITDMAASGNGAASLQRVLHLEEDRMMIRLDQSQQEIGSEPDVWQWGKMTQVDPEPFTVPFNLPDLSANGEMTLAVNFRGLSAYWKNPTDKNQQMHHRVEVSVNGSEVGAFEWDGRDEVKKTLQVPAKLLKVNDNALTLRIPKRFRDEEKKDVLIDVVMFNWASVTYPITGDLDAGAFSFSVKGDANQDIALAWKGQQPPLLYGDDGKRRLGTASNDGHYRYAGAAAGVEQFPALDGSLATPVLLKPVADSHDWTNPGEGYDYLIVSHPTLIDAVKPLADFHAKQGRKVALVDVNELYDQFNGGIVHPQAIQRFVANGYKNWKVKPKFLLLVGKASFDIRNREYHRSSYATFAGQSFDVAMPGGFAEIPGTLYADQPDALGDSNLIPTWQFPSPEGQSASDNPYGAVDGDSWKPVVAVGRFPVVKPADVSAIVKKTINYMSKPAPGAWRRDVMFISDDSEYFKQSSDEISSSLASDGYAIDKVYAQSTEADNAANKARITDGLNEGQLLVHFIGHGGRYIWRTGPPDLTKNHDLFTLDDVAALNNGGRLPMILSMTCYSAPFDNPSEDSIGERFLREADKGAVAVFAASWRKAPSARFSKALVDALMVPGQTIGVAINKAKADEGDRVLVEMYNLLGDPAVVLEAVPEKILIARSDDRWAGGFLIDLPMSRFDGTVDVRWYDDQSKVIGETHQTLDQPRFTLQVPGWINEKDVASFRVRARDDNVASTAAGEFQVRPNAPPKPSEGAKAALKAVTVPVAPATAPSSDEENLKLKLAAQGDADAVAEKMKANAKLPDAARKHEKEAQPAK